VAILNPDHLFDQADKLIIAPATGAPRQVDLRRAVSSAYYGVFHATLAAAADELVGRTKRGEPRYQLVYRSVSHRALFELCVEVRKPQAKPRYARFVPAQGFGANIEAFATAAIELQEKRNGADYDPSVRIKTADAKLAMDTARTAVGRFQKASRVRRQAFLTLLLFRPRAQET